MRENARSVALQALLQVEENEGYSNIVIDKALRAAGLDARDGALASSIFYGVLERRLTLDYYLAQCLKSPGKKLDPLVQSALRCGAYQILYLDRVPDSAAVNETVALVKAGKKLSAAGLVNGVLRSLSRRKGSLTLPEGDSPKALSVRYSVPEELILLWRKSYGKSFTARLLESFQKRPALYLRLNPLRTTKDDLAAALEGQGCRIKPLGGLPWGAALEGSGSPAALPQFQEGLFHVQDLSAQLACQLVGAKPGERVCDCCAAPGGKSFTLAEDMENTGELYAFDLYKGRVGLIQQGAERLGLSCILAQRRDGTKPYEDLPQMDRVLCDAPCSGYGVLRRKPEIRYKSLESAKELPELQLSLLENAAGLVRPGGLLVYSTCTLHPAENSGVAQRFLAAHPEFAPEAIRLAGVERCLDEPEHMLTMTPFSGASDGFFAACFRRKEG